MGWGEIDPHRRREVPLPPAPGLPIQQSRLAWDEATDRQVLLEAEALLRGGDFVTLGGAAARRLAEAIANTVGLEATATRP